VFSESDLKIPGVSPVTVPDVRNMDKNEAQKLLKEARLGFDLTGAGNTVTEQFPIPGEIVNQGQNILLRIGEAPHDP
jgi:stage V sporulation protein D (sporulation-specific penicillin-binding protein)